MSDRAKSLAAAVYPHPRTLRLLATTLYVLAALALALGLIAGAGAATTQFFESATPHRLASTPAVYETGFTAVRGRSPFDRIALHRLTRDAAAQPHPAIVMLYLPGTNMNGEVAIADRGHSLPVYLASHGVDFWALDYRTHFIPPATRTSDLGELRDWTSDLFQSDIAAAATFIEEKTGAAKIFVAGFSRGASFAYLFAARHAGLVEGLVVFDGWIPPPGPPASRPPKGFASDIGGAHLAYDQRQALLRLVIDNPDGPAPIPAYKTARENLEQVVYGSAAFGGHGGLANPIGGFSDPVVLARILIRYDRYWPAVQDYENPFTPMDLTNLAISKIPVIAFSSTNISAAWPQRVARSAASTGASDVTVKTLDDWGHLDVICGTKAEPQVFAPTLAWLRQHRERRDRRHRADWFDHSGPAAQ